MKYLSTGQIIKEFRERLGISQSVLCEGLCEPPTLSKIETGRQNPNKKLLDALVARLHIPVVLNVPVTLVEFERAQIEREITSHIAHNDYEIDSLLEKYKEQSATMEKFELQFYMYAKAVQKSRLKKEYREALAELLDALRVTYPDYILGKDLSNHLFIPLEISILNNIAICLHFLNRSKEANLMLIQLFHSLENDSIEKEEYARIYPMIAYNLSMWLGVEKNYSSDKKFPCKTFTNIFANEKILIPLYMYGPSYPHPALNAREAEFVNSIYYKNGKLTSCFYKDDFENKYLGLESSLKYCSSVGGAAGIDFSETFLHALNEIIERDTTSEFLLKGIIKNNYDSYSIIDKKSLDIENKDIANYIEKSYKIELFIIDITGLIGIPTIMVFDKENKFAKETLLTGYGTSLSIEYAIQRALLEYKQTIDLVLYDATLPKDDNFKDLLEKKNVNGFFKKLYYFNQDELIRKLKAASLNELKNKYNLEAFCSSSKNMLNEVLGILKRNKYNVFYNDISFNCNKNTIHYVKAIIPQMCDITDPGPLRLPTRRKITDLQNVETTL